MSSYRSVPLSPSRGISRQQHPGSPPDPMKSRPKEHRFPFLHTRKGIIITVVVVLVIVGGGLTGLAALPKHNNKEPGSSGKGTGGGSDGEIQDDSHFYGQSPPVYPSREYLFLLMVGGGLRKLIKGLQLRWQVLDLGRTPSRKLRRS